MNDKKDQYVTSFQAAMLILNIIAVGLICGFIYVTTNRFWLIMMRELFWTML